MRQRLVLSIVLTVPVLLMAMIPALQFTNWQWLSLTLAAGRHLGGMAVPQSRNNSATAPRPWTPSSR